MYIFDDILAKGRSIKLQTRNKASGILFEKYTADILNCSWEENIVLF